MGEGIKVVSINGTAYIIKSGHNNQDLSAITIALEEHGKRLIKDQEYYDKNDARDKDGVPIYADTSVNEISVCDGVEIN